MKDFKRWLNESVLPNIQIAIDTLKGRKDQKDLVWRIQAADPYRDKRFAPVIAGWVAKHGITPEEHADDVKQFKELRRRLKDLRVPANNRERTALVKQLLSRKPHHFAHHYSTLQDWNRKASDMLDPQKDLSDEGLPVEMRHDGYTMYRIDTKEHLLVPIVKNSMSWCITKGSFGGYGGPPYYPVVRDHDRSPFAVIIPAYFDENPDQAVRNAQNDGRISPRDLRLIRPLVQQVLPLDKHNHPYIRGVHGIRKDLPEHPSSDYALDLMIDLALEPGEWPEGELVISRHPFCAYMYARDVLKGPFPQGEPAISQDLEYAYRYARDVIERPWPAGEPTISRDTYYSYRYARDVIERPWPAGEPAISRDTFYAYRYARDIIKGPWPAGEPAISRYADFAYLYARDVIKGPFPQGEHAISKDPEWAYLYAQDVLTGPFPAGEPAIARSLAIKNTPNNRPILPTVPSTTPRNSNNPINQKMNDSESNTS